MRVIARRTLREFWEQSGRKDAKQPLLAWFKEAKKAQWLTPADIKAKYRSADFVANDRVIFNIGGNKYRLVVAVKYGRKESGRTVPGIVFVKFVGTHAEYNTIDPETV